MLLYGEKNIILVWASNMVNQVIALMNKRQENITITLETIPPKATIYTRRKWNHLLDTLWSVLNESLKVDYMFSLLKHDLREARDHCFCITEVLHEK